MPTPLRLTISHAKPHHREAAHRFHAERAGEHLWARSVEDFDALIRDNGLYIVHSDGVIHGLCYVAVEGRTAEFGGVYISEQLRGKGIAGALARTAIAQIYLTASPHHLIAHVHVDNELPRDLLERLGFDWTKQIKATDAPPSMARNPEGDVLGDEFALPRSVLANFADWFESFSGTLVGSNEEETIEMDIDVEIWRRRARWLPALRELAAMRADDYPPA